MEQFLGPSSDFFRFNTNDINILVTPIDKKTSLLTKRNVIRTTATTSSAALAVLNNSLTCSTLSSFCSPPEPEVVAPPKLEASKKLSSASTPKLSLKDKYKHVKSTIPPPRPVNPPAKARSQLRSKSSNNIKDMIVKDLHSESTMSFNYNKSNMNNKTLSNENVLDESIYNDSNADNDEFNTSSVYEDKTNDQVSCKWKFRRALLAS